MSEERQEQKSGRSLYRRCRLAWKTSHHSSRAVLIKMDQMPSPLVLPDNEFEAFGTCLAPELALPRISALRIWLLSERGEYRQG